MSARRLTLTLACLALVAAGIALNWHDFGRRAAVAQRIDFNRDIRPILNQNCISCHGGVKQAAQVSFIYREEALGKGKSGRPTVTPGRPEASELIARVTSHDPEVRMPLHAPPLSTQQIGMLRQWIKEGAQWENYWAFVPPKAPPLPQVKQTDWVRQPLDRFILARLEKEGLQPSPEADKAALLRRASFDLTGLPPTPEELSVFLADSAPNAFEKQVDRLLASPHYGERWAAMWLDLARYADSRGYEQDRERTVWPYRDWVIAAFNRNLPYDRFVITQLAGDLLPNATFEDRIATAFNRQTPANDEAGTDDEEFRTAAVIDRVSTTWSALNGVSFNCVQCHSHPYDPIRHEEFYKFLAFFNTSADDDAQFDDGPVLHVPKDEAQYPRAFRLQQEIAALSKAVVDEGRRLAGASQWKPLPIVAAVTDKTLGLQRQVALYKRQGPNLLAEAGQLTAGSPHKRSLFNLFVSEIYKQTDRDPGGAHVVTPFSLRGGEAWATPKNVSDAAVSDFVAISDIPVLSALRVEVLPLNPEVARHSPEDAFIVERIDAWIVQPDGREEKILLRSFAPDMNDDWQKELALIGAASGNAKFSTPGAPALPVQTQNGAFQATKLFHERWMVGIPAKPIHLPPGSRIKIQLTQNNNLAIVGGGALKPTVAKRIRLLASADRRWTALAVDTLREKRIARIEALYQELANLPTVSVPVMAEQQDDQRQTLRFERGSFLNKTGVALMPGVPALFPKLPSQAPRNRLTMARWFFAPSQPLTARVAVNRYWEQLFGTGIVETLEDFGSAGEKPSHPQLLDWLALRFQNDLKWDMKALLRELVLSATYRQSAKTTEEFLKKDPRNRLLARGPRQRLTAEMVRDQALAASGLLTATLGGPPAMPPLPTGVEVPVNPFTKVMWTEVKGSDRYRRAVYTRLKRTSPYPSMTTFDGSARDVSLARRIPTNTPLQALVTLNDTVQEEAAAALAERLLKETPTAIPSGTDLIERRLNYGARLVLSRDLRSGELSTLRALYERALERTSNPTQGNTRSSHPEFAALKAVTSVLLNFDAALAR